jgi:hypothetical protein
MGDPAFLAKKMGEYKLLNNVVSEQQQFWKEHFVQMGVDVQEYDTRAVKEALYEKALHSPEEIVKKAETMKALKDSATELLQLEARLQELGGKEALEQELAEKRTEYDRIESAQKMATDYGVGKAKVWGSLVGNRVLAFFSEWKVGQRSSASERADKDRKTIEDYKYVKEKYEDADYMSLELQNNELRLRINEIGTLLDGIEDISKKKQVLQEQFIASRKEVLQAVGDYKDFAVSMQNKIKLFFENKMKAGDLQSLEEAQSVMNKIKAEQKGPIGINLAGAYAGEKTLESLQDSLNSFIRTQTFKAIEKAVKETDGGSSTFALIEKALFLFFNKNMGSIESSTAREFVIKAIIDVRDKLEQTPEDKIKFLFINRILIKLKK